MNRPGSLVPPSPDSEREGRTSPSQQRWKRLLWGRLLLGIGLVVLLAVFAGLLQRRPPPLRSDPNTLYLVNSSQDLSFSSLPSQWHWQVLKALGALFVVAPYHPTGEGLEIDAQISDAGADNFQNDDAFGIAIGLDNQGAGYICGITLFQPIATYPGTDQPIQGETTSGWYGDFSDYVTVTVTIQNNIITLSEDGKRVAQATATAYHTNGLIGLFLGGGSPTVRGFRVESLS
jgi:hypothetical protein